MHGDLLDTEYGGVCLEKGGLESSCIQEPVGWVSHGHQFTKSSYACGHEVNSYSFLRDYFRKSMSNKHIHFGQGMS